MKVKMEIPKARSSWCSILILSQNIFYPLSSLKYSQMKDSRIHQRCAVHLTFLSISSIFNWCSKSTDFKSKLLIFMTIVNYVCPLMKHKTLYLMATYLFKVFSKARNSRLMALVGYLKALPQQCQCTMRYS